MPARVLMQVTSHGVPAVVDLAAMRDAMRAILGGDSRKDQPPAARRALSSTTPSRVDEFGTVNSYDLNAALEFTRNRERYAFLKWGQTAFRNFSAVPPGMGICHQVNLEYLARVVFTTHPAAQAGRRRRAIGHKASIEEATVLAYPDTSSSARTPTPPWSTASACWAGASAGTEAEAAMLGQPVSMLVPAGRRLPPHRQAPRRRHRHRPRLLTVTEALRKHGVVGKFVEFFGPGIAELPLADRATIANMAPEYGATCGIFPVDAETSKYLRLTGRTEEHIALVEAYVREQGLFHTATAPEAEYSSTLHLDLSTVEPSVAGPRRPQDRVPPLARPPPRFPPKSSRRCSAPNGNQDSARQMVRWGGRRRPPLRQRQPHSAPPSRPLRLTHRCLCHPEGGPASAGPQSRLRFFQPAPSSVKARFGVDPDPLPRQRRRRHRRHHLLHQHLEPLHVMVAAGSARQEGQVERLASPHAALGQDASLAPGSRVVTDYYNKAGLTQYLDALRSPQHRRLRLHHLHRQLPARFAHRRLRRHRAAPARRCLRPLRQPATSEGRISPPRSGPIT